MRVLARAKGWSWAQSQASDTQGEAPRGAADTRASYAAAGLLLLVQAVFWGLIWAVGDRKERGCGGGGQRAGSPPSQASPSHSGARGMESGPRLTSPSFPGTDIPTPVKAPKSHTTQAERKRELGAQVTEKQPSGEAGSSLRLHHWNLSFLSAWLCSSSVMASFSGLLFPRGGRTTAGVLASVPSG